MSKPVLVAVDDDPAALDPVGVELRKRYQADYEIRLESSGEAALGLLAAMRTAGREVALILADQWMPGLTGIELLARAHGLHPHAHRAVLISWAEQASAPVLRASALRQVDDWIAKPWRPGDEHFHQAVSQALFRWSVAHRPQFVSARVVAEPWSARSHEIRDLLSRNSVPFEYLHPASSEGRALLDGAGVRAGRLPVVVLFDGRALVDPTAADIASALGVRTRPGTAPYDVAIVGAGPAGLAAAVYGASEGLRTAVLEPEAMGGQAGTSSMIRNYLGFPRGISGAELAHRAYEQAWLLGAEFIYGQRAVGLGESGQERCVLLRDGSRLTAPAVILATGVRYRKLDIPALDELIGAGVFYGAAAPEAEAMTGEDVYVVGGANSAGQAALHLARYAGQVSLVVRGSSLAHSMSDYLVREIEAAANIAVRYRTEVVDGGGEGRLTRLVLRDGATGRSETLPAAGLFILIGAEPHTNWLPDAVQRDPSGYVLTGTDRPGRGTSSQPASLFETTVRGVFAVGDVRHGSVKRVASAVGEGAVVVRHVHDYLSMP